MGFVVLYAESYVIGMTTAGQNILALLIQALTT